MITYQQLEKYRHCWCNYRQYPRLCTSMNYAAQRAAHESLSSGTRECLGVDMQEQSLLSDFGYDSLDVFQNLVSGRFQARGIQGKDMLTCLFNNKLEAPI